jgi:crotonobetainyl-CoA:carnitine CoA-transferase CaiB-like acyl-CoA transferase
MSVLDDVTVLDVTQMVAGPLASMVLADMGAEVLKIERPDGGELGRSNPPFTDGHSAYFASVNRNKRSVALDLKSEDGREAFLALAAEADVVVENNPAGRMERFGLGYETVREHNEGIVYCSITGFGQDGPYAGRPALDIVAQAMSGVMSITGPPDGDPYRAGVPIGDIAASMYAVQAVLLALLERADSGQGQRLDVSMLDCLQSWLTVRAGHTFATGEPYPRTGNALAEFVPYGTFEAGDGHLAVVVVADHQWDRLCAALDRPDLGADPALETAAGRREHRERVNGELADTFATATVAEWFDRLADAGVPVAPVYDTRETWADEHVRHRGLRTEIAGGEAIGHPVGYSDIDTPIRRGVPAVGEHTRERLEAAGVAPATVEAVLDRIEPPERDGG